MGKSYCLFQSVLAILVLLFGLQITLPVLAISGGQPSTIQDQSISHSESWRKTAPAIPEPQPFKLPHIIQYKLANGLSVELVEDHRVPFSTVAVGLPVGITSDPKNLYGLSALVADMLSEGTKKYTSYEIANQIDFIGGALASSAGADFTVVSASGLSSYNDQIFELLSDVILHPSFPDNELKLKKTNLIQELKIKHSKPDFLVSECFASVVYGKHPYSVVAPQPEVIEQITKKHLEEFHNAQYLPNKAILVVVGDFKPEAMKILIDKYFGPWVSYPIANIELGHVPQQTGRKIYVVDRPSSVQSTIKLGNLGISRQDPDYYAMIVANQILGGGTTSRLFTNIRENKGYTYGVYSSCQTNKELGTFFAGADVRSEVTAPALQEFLYELAKIRNIKVQDKELTYAKNYLVGSFQLGLETQNGLAQRLLDRYLYGLPSDYLETYANKITSVSIDDVRKVCRRMIDFDNLVICVVGDAAKIKQDLSYFSPVSLYNNKKSTNSPTALSEH